eukprot:4553617-Pyramimonas_sp.AAC.1
MAGHGAGTHAHRERNAADARGMDTLHGGTSLAHRNARGRGSSPRQTQTTKQTNKHEITT